jgi:hypothetical protein
MVRTDEVMTGIAHMPVRQHGTAMRAAIEQHMERAIIAAHQNHRLAANLECGEIALILYLAFMTSINPALVKNVVDFLLEDLFTCIAGLVNPISIDQALYQGFARCIAVHDHLPHIAFLF